MTSNTKKCQRCKLHKPINQFCNDKTTKDKKSSRCSICRKEVCKIQYDKNREKRIKETIDYNKNKKIKLYEYLLENPCVVCGENDPIVLEFDHIDPKTKTKNISWAITKWSWKRVLKEIEKCQVLCANCHKRKTAKQQKWYEFMNK